MTTIEKLSIDLPPEMAKLVRGAVESGEFASSSEVVREALQEWERLRTRQREQVQELRRLWDDGLASGPGRFADINAIKAEARRRRNAQQRSPDR
jgi:antitoxin ParD1/3/4